MRVIGTAGHVDHGKSTLVRALTGINPDRLKEEQEREMTIDLGFAWLTLPSGEHVGIVDVPGHEAFIKNMLAGVGGIDAALFVVAADEGIMPQTREHLAILDLLRVKGGVVALTKLDLAGEPGWLELVTAETKNALEGTVLEGAPIIPVSAKTGQGLDDLKRELDRTLAKVHERQDLGRPRLSVDRVFSIAGFGTVVTGTLTDGAFEVGDEVEIAPTGLKGRIRGIQSHKEKLKRALPGGRTALNLVGVGANEVARGDTVVLPGSYRATDMFDARIEWLPTVSKPLTHNQSLDLFALAAQVPARIRLLQGEELKAGETGWAQLILQKPIITAKGDRFILRYPSPSITVGGGQVIEPFPGTRHRRNRQQVIEHLTQAERGTPIELVLQRIEALGPIEAKELANPLGLDEGTVTAAVRSLLSTQDVVEIRHERAGFLLTNSAWIGMCSKTDRILEDYHRQFPLRPGMPREELKSRLNLTPRFFDALVEKAVTLDLIHLNDKAVWRSGHRVEFEPATALRVNQLLGEFEKSPFAPPSFDDASNAVGGEALAVLIDRGQLEKISDQVLLTPQAEMAMKDWILVAIQDHGQVTAAELRDHFNTSRKYAIAFLEYLDQKRVTKRIGDARVIR